MSGPCRGNAAGQPRCECVHEDGRVTVRVGLAPVWAQLEVGTCRARAHITRRRNIQIRGRGCWCGAPACVWVDGVGDEGEVRGVRGERAPLELDIVEDVVNTDKFCPGYTAVVRPIFHVDRLFQPVVIGLRGVGEQIKATIFPRKNVLKSKWSRGSNRDQ